MRVKSPELLGGKALAPAETRVYRDNAEAAAAKRDNKKKAARK